MIKDLTLQVELIETHKNQIIHVNILLLDGVKYLNIFLHWEQMVYLYHLYIYKWYKYINGIEIEVGPYLLYIYIYIYELAYT